MHSLYCSPRIYSHHYFVSEYSLPKNELSQLVCFFGIHYTGALFTYIINHFLDHCVNTSPAWYALNLSITTKHNPCGGGMFGGKSSLPETWSNFLEVQYWCPKLSWSITWSLGSSKISEFWYLFQYTNIYYSCSRFTFPGTAWWLDIIETSRQRYQSFQSPPSISRSQWANRNILHLQSWVPVIYQYQVNIMFVL